MTGRALSLPNPTKPHDKKHPSTHAYRQPCLGLGALSSGLGILDVIAPDTTLFPSRGEAKKLLAAGGVSLNKHRAELDQTVTAADLIAGRYLVVQKGKRNYALVVATSN